MPEYVVSSEEAGDRLDHFLASKLPELSRSRLQALVKEGHVLLNGGATKPSEKIRPGNVVQITIPEPTAPTDTLPQEIPLEILYEDDDLLVINKAAGMVVHPAAGNPDGTLVNALLHHCTSLSGIGGEQRPGIVHRLDKETSGCMVVAKNDFSHQALSKQFADRQTMKVYLALVTGRFKAASGTVVTDIGRHPVHRKKMAVLNEGKGRNAVTDWRVLRELPKGTLVECTLHTGRTHQIRVHMKHLGHPLLGDELYGKRAGFERQMLHAWKLGFHHPRTGQWMQFESVIPDDFVAAGAVPPQG